MTRHVLPTALMVLITSLMAGTAVATGDDAPQAAVPEDMKIFAPYIGVFRSPTEVFDDGKTEYYFTIDYHWFDAQKTIVKYVVSMVIPSQHKTIINSEGFYGYDPFHRNLYVFGAFTRSMTGWGTVGRFDHATGRRETWAKSMNADGVVTHVRDAFEPVDANSWTNTTRIRQGGQGEWTQVHQALYTRMH